MSQKVVQRPISDEKANLNEMEFQEDPPIGEAKPLSGSSRAPADLESSQAKHDRNRLRTRLGLFYQQQPGLSTLLLIVLITSIGALIILAVATALVGCYYASIIYEAMPLTEPHLLHENYTVVIMSYEARMDTLPRVVSHYGRCPSVEEILIVWNKGTPPIPGVDLISPKAPIRVRQEVDNSINNRFRPDPEIKTRAVLQVDDDELLLCSDLEAGFEEWLRHPTALVGYFPRLIVVDPQPQYLGESVVFEQGTYNAMITAGEFLSVDLFDEYWSEEMASARALVDDLFNCEDILMNFIVGRREQKRIETLDSSVEKGLETVRYVRPRRRLDISWLSGVGISRGSSHVLKRRHCVGHFSKQFGGLPLRNATVRVGETPLCSIPGAGCIYL